MTQQLHSWMCAQTTEHTCLHRSFYVNVQNSQKLEEKTIIFKMPQFSIQNFYPCKDLRMYARIPGRKDNRNHPRMCLDNGQRRKGTEGHDASTKRENVSTQTKYRKQAESLVLNSAMPEMQVSLQQTGAARRSRGTWSKDWSDTTRAFTAQFSCLMLKGVNILPHRWEPRLQEDASDAQHEQPFRKCTWTLQWDTTSHLSPWL